MLDAFKREQLQGHNRTPMRCWADLLQLLLLLLRCCLHHCCLQVG
jgi:hypothetical protein